MIMIKSEIVKINKIENFDNLYISRAIRAMGFDYVRWAIIDIDESFLTITVSYINVT